MLRATGPLSMLLLYTVVKHASWMRDEPTRRVLITVDDTAIDIADDTGNEQVDDTDPIPTGLFIPAVYHLGRGLVS
jgi:hypothetical protein